MWLQLGKQECADQSDTAYDPIRKQGFIDDLPAARGRHKAIDGQFRRRGIRRPDCVAS
jgi:hypothetical protein